MDFMICIQFGKKWGIKIYMSCWTHCKINLIDSFGRFDHGKNLLTQSLKNQKFASNNICKYDFKDWPRIDEHGNQERSESGKPKIRKLKILKKPNLEIQKVTRGQWPN